MKHLLSAGICLLALSLGGQAHGFPEVAECKGALTPSLSNGCQGIGYVGCCDVVGRQFWCDDGDLYCVDCADGFPACGWNTLGYYDCGQEPMSADPTGENPYACGACGAACGEGAPCSEACPGGCGACAGDGICLDDGSCYEAQCDGKECGLDPMGLSCGTCPAGSECVDGIQICMALPGGCVAKTEPGCDGCGCESCVCETYPTCCTENWDLLCVTACIQGCGQDCSACPAEPSCEGLECGAYCGKSCGACPEGETCKDFQCCTPACDGKTCGPDGCGGSCGTCAGTDECGLEGQCLACQPACDGKACGDDGCGGTCGTCPETQICSAGSCALSHCKDRCGDLYVSCGPGCECFCDKQCFDFNDCCDGVCQVCAGDYPEICCDSACNGKECGDDGCGGSCGSCGEGSICDGGLCASCVAQCANKACGDDSCGGSCGSCAPGETCEAGVCKVCEPQCAGKACGDDGCGGVCGTCGAGLACEGGACVPDGSCGDIAWEGCCWDGDLYYCDQGELVEESCAQDPCGWNPDGGQSGWYDCEFEGAEPSGVFPYDCWELPCEPQCGAGACGDDGCGGSCAACGEGELCEAGTCVPEADPCLGITEAGCCEQGALIYCADGQIIGGACEDQPCGWSEDALGGQGGYRCGGWGADPSGELSHSCDGSCYSECWGRECGDDGCAGSCGTCPDGVACEAGHCAGPCEPACDGHSCGPDGCGGSCGLCAPGEACNTGGACVNPDDCEAIGYDGACQGDIVTWCESGVIIVYDCAEVGKTCGYEEASGNTCVSGGPCVPDCDGKVCGPDGCGYDCGACPHTFVCSGGSCIEEGPDVIDSPDAPPSADIELGPTDVGTTAFSSGSSSSGCAGESPPVGWLYVLMSCLALRMRPRREPASWD